MKIKNNSNDYKYGFESNIAQDVFAKGLNEEVIKNISRQKNEPTWLLEFRLKAYKHWLTLKEPHWANIFYLPIDYQDISYFASPKTDSTDFKSQNKIEQLQQIQNYFSEENLQKALEKSKME